MMSTSIPTNSLFSSVYSNGLNTVSIAITHVLSDAVVSAASAASSAVSSAASAVSVVSAAEESLDEDDPHAAVETAMHAMRDSAINFFIICTLLFSGKSAGPIYAKRHLYYCIQCLLFENSIIFSLLLVKCKLCNYRSSAAASTSCTARSMPSFSVFRHRS